MVNRISLLSRQLGEKMKLSKILCCILIFSFSVSVLSIRNMIIFLLSVISMFLATFGLMIRYSNIGFRLRKRELLAIFLPSILMYFHVLYSMEEIYNYWHWTTELKFLMILFYPFIVLLMFFIGAFIYYVLSNPRVLRYFLHVSFLLTKGWNFIQLKKTKNRFKFNTFYRELNRLTDFQIFFHFTFGQFFISLFLTFIHLETFDILLVLEIEDIPWNIKAFFCLLALYALQGPP